MSPFASRRGLPTFSDSRRDSSSKRSRTCWPRSHRNRPRLLGSRSLQSGDSKARLAASTAASTSSFPPDATRAIGRFGTGEGRLAFVVADLGGRVIGVDLDRVKLMHARAYAGIRDFRNVEFALGDVEQTPYHELARDPIDAVVSNLCMSPEIVWHSSRAMRPGGTFVFCAHHGDHWKETRRGSRWAFYEDSMRDLLEENRFQVEFLGVDTTAVAFEDLREVELFLRDATVRRWVEDGRWQELADAFDRGERHLTLSYLIAKARRTAAPYAVD